MRLEASCFYLGVPGSSGGCVHGLCTESGGWAVGLMSAVTEQEEGEASRGFDPEAWIRPLCALVVAGVAAYASYVHQREFARQGGADTVSASLWPL